MLQRAIFTFHEFSYVCSFQNGVKYLIWKLVVGIHNSLYIPILNGSGRWNVQIRLFNSITWFPLFIRVKVAARDKTFFVSDYCFLFRCHGETKPTPNFLILFTLRRINCFFVETLAVRTGKRSISLFTSFNEKIQSSNQLTNFLSGDLIFLMFARFSLSNSNFTRLRSFARSFVSLRYSLVPNYRSDLKVNELHT